MMVQLDKCQRQLKTQRREQRAQTKKVIELKERLELHADWRTEMERGNW